MERASERATALRTRRLPQGDRCLTPPTPPSLPTRPPALPPFCLPLSPLSSPVSSSHFISIRARSSVAHAPPRPPPAHASLLRPSLRFIRALDCVAARAARPAPPAPRRRGRPARILRGTAVRPPRGLGVGPGGLGSEVDVAGGQALLAARAARDRGVCGSQPDRGICRSYQGVCGSDQDSRPGGPLGVLGVGPGKR